MYEPIVSRQPVRRLALLGMCALLGALVVAHADTPKAGTMVPENLALRKPATASSFQFGHAPADGNDGSVESRWCADGGESGQWWQVDLGKPETLTGCHLVWEQGTNPYHYKVEGSADAAKWTLLVDETAGKLTGQSQRHTFKAADVRYVRLTISGLPAGAWASFFEFEVFGTKLVKAEQNAGVNRLDPKMVLGGMKAPDGFDLTLFAAPPNVSYPTCLCALPDGTLFVGVDKNGSLGKKPKNGSVIRCIDTDGDGKADTFNVFTTVDAPRGLWYDHKTLYVLHPPDLTAYYDDDGDGVADRSEVLVTGLGDDTLKARGADHSTNGFRMGIDGWFYIAVGDYGALKAKGKDGQTVHLHGGGVFRVRPDGSGLELVADGLRNIYDVAVSPQLDLFTRDNTNDGGGWDVRLSHIIPTAHYGYPTLFVNFPDEIIQPLADYGGGAPCGSLYLDEPGLPKDCGTALYTCDWGRGAVYRHPQKQNGASWKVEQKVFLDIPRPTDMDVDGAGRIYVSSWKDGGFDFSNPNVGFVARLSPKGNKPTLFPDVAKATDLELVQFHAAPSQVLRQYAQRELLRRGPKPATATALEELAAGKASLAARVAAICTLKQLMGMAAQPGLLRLVKQDDVREYALRELVDNLKELDGVPTQPYLDGLKDANARVRLQAVIGLARLNKLETAAALLEATTDSDSNVAHVAVNALVTLRAVAACFKALDSASTVNQVPGALRALQGLHEPAVVDGLLARLGTTTDQTLRRGLLRTLARLHQREAEWDGHWWGTRPDTTGPYFKPVTWAESGKIAAALGQAFAQADGPTLKWLIGELQRHRVDLPELTPRLLALAGENTDFRRLAVAIFADRSRPPEQAIPLFAAVGSATDEDANLRVKAVRALTRMSATAGALDSAIAALTVQDKPPQPVHELWDEFVRDGRHVGNVSRFVALTDDAAPRKRELGLAVLASIAGRNLGSKEARALAETALDKGWTKPESAIAQLHVIGRLNLSGFAPKVRALLDDPNPQVASAAKTAAAALKIAKNSAASGPLVKTLKYEQVVAQSAKEKGDATLGAALFSRVGCVNCHTITATEPLKGPLLAGIAARYNRLELLESILKPSAKIAQGFETQVLALNNGKLVTGFIVRESGTELELRDGAGAVSIVKKEDIDERNQSKVSVMPEQLADNLTVRELASILAYLESLKGK